MQILASRSRRSSNMNDDHQALLNTSTSSTVTNNNSHQSNNLHLEPPQTVPNFTQNNGAWIPNKVNNNTSSHSLPGVGNEVDEKEKMFSRRPSLGQIELAKPPKPTKLARLVAKNGECMVRPIHNQNPYLSMYRWVCFWKQ